MYASELQDVFNCTSKSMINAFKELGEELEIAATVIKKINIEIDAINNKAGFETWLAQRQINQVAWGL